MGKTRAMIEPVVTLSVLVLLVLGGIALVNWAQGTSRAQMDADQFNYMDAASAGQDKANLCRQAEKTAESFDRQGDAIKFASWLKVAIARCKGFNVEGRPFLGH